MQTVDVGHGRGWLDAPAAASLARMDAARGDWLRTNSTGRTRAEQEDAYRKYLAGGSFAARPGTSPHEFGNATDFHVTCWVWLLDHGEDHGWYLTIKSEPWHRVYFPHRDKHRFDPAPAHTNGAFMALTSDQQDEVLHHLRNLSAQVLGTGGFEPSVAGRVIRIDESVQNLNAQVTGAGGFEPNLVGHVLDVKRLLGGDRSPLDALSDADVARVAVAVAAEHARRLAN